MARKNNQASTPAQPVAQNEEQNLDEGAQQQADQGAPETAQPPAPPAEPTSDVRTSVEFAGKQSEPGSYEVVNPIQMDGVLYDRGALIALTSEQAAAMPWAVKAKP